MSVNTKYTDKPNDQYQRADFKGLVGYFHKRCRLFNRTLKKYPKDAQQIFKKIIIFRPPNLH